MDLGELLGSCLPCEALESRLLPSSSNQSRREQGSLASAIKCFGSEGTHVTSIHKALFETSQEGLSTHKGVRKV